MTVIRLGNKTVGIGAYENTLLFKKIEDKNVGEKHEDTIEAADIAVEFNNLDNLRCIRDRLCEIEEFLRNKLS